MASGQWAGQEGGGRGRRMGPGLPGPGRGGGWGASEGGRGQDHHGGGPRLWPARQVLSRVDEVVYLTVDIHLPIGKQILNHIIVAFLGSQVQTGGALCVLQHKCI